VAARVCTFQSGQVHSLIKTSLFASNTIFDARNISAASRDDALISSFDRRATIAAVARIGIKASLSVSPGGMPIWNPHVSDGRDSPL
jgi:hypothetical protein